MFQVHEIERRQMNVLVGENKLVTTALESVIENQPKRAWDGFIHASKLDWTKTPAAQFEKHVKTFSFNSSYARAGDLFHNDIHAVLDAYFGGGGIPEHRFRFEELCLQGTVDRIQAIPQVGNVLMEFKTTLELERDKAGADRIIKGLMNDKHSGDALTISKFFNENEKDILDRLRSRTRIISPKQDHLTQMFTYAWALQAQFDLKKAVLVYVSRDSYKIVGEYWYDLTEHAEKIYKAYYNFNEVLQCLKQFQEQLRIGSNGENQLYNDLQASPVLI